MNSMQNRSLKALPNVLHDQTIPNTLGGLGPPQRASRAGPRVGALVAALAVSSAAVIGLIVLAIVLGRPG